VKLPDNSDREYLQIISDSENTRLGLAFKTQVQQHQAVLDRIHPQNLRDGTVGAGVFAGEALATSTNTGAGYVEVTYTISIKLALS